MLCEFLEEIVVGLARLLELVEFFSRLLCDWNALIC